MSSSQIKNVYHCFPEEIEIQFNKIFRLIKILGCDYFYFIGEDTGARHRFCTHVDWLDFYATERLVLNDPLKRVAESSKFIALPWQQVTNLYGKDKLTMSARTSFGLYNGITIAREHQQRKYIFALASELKEHDLGRYLLLEKVDSLQKVVYDTMKLFDQYIIFMMNMTTSTLQ